MSLFGALFEPKHTAEINPLFAEDSKYKANLEPIKRPTLPRAKASPQDQQPPPSLSQTKRKRKAAEKRNVTAAAASTKRTKSIAKQPSSDDDSEGDESDANEPTARTRSRSRVGGSEDDVPDANGDEVGDSDLDSDDSEEGIRRYRAAAGAPLIGDTETESETENEIDSVSDEDNNGQNDDDQFGVKNGSRPPNDLSTESEKLSRTIFVGNLPPWAQRKAIAALFAQYGAIESVRLRSVPLQSDSKLPRRAAIATGAVETSKGSAHAYVVFETRASAHQALLANMRPVEFGQSTLSSSTSAAAYHVITATSSGGAMPSLSDTTRHLIVNPAGSNIYHVKKAQKIKGKAAATQAASLGAKVQYDPAFSVFVGNVHLEADDEELIRFFSKGLGAGAEASIQAVRIVRDPKTSMGKGIAFVLLRTKPARRAALALDGRKFRGRPLRVTPVAAAQTASSGSRGGNANTMVIGGSGAVQRTVLNDNAHASWMQDGNGGGGGGGGKETKKRKTVAPWQGVAATKSGRARGMMKPVRAAGATGGSSSAYERGQGGEGRGRLGRKSKEPVSKKKGGKRPAVAARKLKELGLAPPGGVKKPGKAKHKGKR
jgi:nucleolar protein 12